MKSRFILFSTKNIQQRKNIIINGKIITNQETIEILENASKNDKSHEKLFSEALTKNNYRKSIKMMMNSIKKNIKLFFEIIPTVFKENE